MEAKEKAKELVSKFTELNRGNQTFNAKYNNGIRGALLCVEEILPNIDDHSYELWGYWTEVKEEISKI